MRRFWPVLLVIPVLVIAANYLPDGGVQRAAFVRFADFGTPDDYSDARDVYFPKPPENYWLWGQENPNQFIHYETPDRFYWVTKPKMADRYTSARVIKSYYTAKLRIKKPEALSGAGMLAIRYKDNLLQPTSVEVLFRGEWRRLGTLGGQYDHAWKVASFVFDVRQTDVENGTYLVRIGRGDYGDLRGDLPIDWVGLANGPVQLPAPTPGFWPAPAASNFAKIGQTREYVPGQGPVFLTGILVKGMRTGSWEYYAQNKVNALIFQGWETEWRRRWETYAEGGYNDRVRYGFPDWTERCARNKLLCTSQFFTDTRSYWIERQYRDEYEALDTLGEVMSFNRNAPGNLCWYLKDEADHNDSTWGSPPEFILQLYNLQKKSDPSRAAAVLFQGWKPGSFAMYKQMLDIAAFDVYPLGAGRPLNEVWERTERMRAEVGPDKALWAVVEGHEGEHVRDLRRQLTAAEVLVEGYACLAHDIHGVFYYIDNIAAYIDVDRMPGPWAGMKQFFAEVNGPAGIAPWFLPPSRTVARTGMNDQRVGAEDKAIHFIQKIDGQNRPLFVAVNTVPRDKQQARLFAQGLAAGTTVKVLFENRTLTAGADGAIVDNFAAYGRHVYTW